MNQIITRKQAKNQKLSKFFTGKECKNGHIAERFTASSACVLCHRSVNNKHASRKYAADPTFQQRCKEYQKQYRVENPDKYREMLQRRNTPEYLEKQRTRSKIWHHDNIEQQNEYSRQYHQNKYYNDTTYRNKFLELSRAYRKRNPIKYKLHALNRLYYIRQATVSWGNADKISDIYERASQLQQTTGIKHEVDHIIPLRGRNVCGLHWELNLQILTASDNRKKSNTFKT